MGERVVSVFGSGSAVPGTPDYEEAEQLGRLLAEAGYTVMTGGYAGLMEAASKGAHASGGRVIGVTVGAFEQNGHQPNAYNDDIIQFATLPERLLHLVRACDAVVALPGGIGTLSEVALTWSLLQTGEIAPKPFILLGEQWHALLRTFYGEGKYIREPYMHLFQIARTPEQVITLIRNWG